LLLEGAVSIAPGDAIAKELSCGRLSVLPVIAGGDAARSSMRAARLVVADPSCRYARGIDEAVAQLEKSSAALGVILVASSVAGEGAEHVASNLAHHLARRGGRTLLVDADARAKSLTRQLAVETDSGLFDVLTRHRSLDDAILCDGLTGLHFLPATGPAPIVTSAHDVLRSGAFEQAMKALRARFDMVVIAAPPLLPAVDGKLIAKRVDGIIFVASCERTPPAMAKAALRTLGSVREKLTGAVFTDAPEQPTAAEQVMRLSAIVGEAREAMARLSAHRRAA
jgi:Mrp family chromosome partitioning ATPase